MRPSYWLASYPKSGNTWLRILLANIQSSDGPVDINQIDSTEAIASARLQFDGLTMVESGLLHPHEVDALRPALHIYLAETDDEELRDDLPVRFIKTHDSYSRNDRGAALLGGARAATGALLIVRDPRDVAISFAHHLERDIDTVIAAMANPDFALMNHAKRLSAQLRQLLSGWSGFNASWLDQHEVPVLPIRYEDLLADTASVLSNVLEHVGWPTDPALVARAVARSSLDELQRQERHHGFREAPTRGNRFFRRGIAGGWRDTLSDEQVARIEAEHAPMMRRLGYGLTHRGETR